MSTTSTGKSSLRTKSSQRLAATASVKSGALLPIQLATESRITS